MSDKDMGAFWDDVEDFAGGPGGFMGKGDFDKAMRREQAIGKGGDAKRDGLLESILNLLEGVIPSGAGTSTLSSAGNMSRGNEK
jgi:hypothetical protein